MRENVITCEEWSHVVTPPVFPVSGLFGSRRIWTCWHQAEIYFCYCKPGFDTLLAVSKFAKFSSRQYYITQNNIFHKKIFSLSNKQDIISSLNWYALIHTSIVMTGCDYYWYPTQIQCYQLMKLSYTEPMPFSNVYIYIYIYYALLNLVPVDVSK